MTPPPADINVDLDLARRLLAEQRPDLLQHRVRLAAEGWDNVLFRVGPDWALRIPRREMAARLIDHEQRWLTELAPHLPIAIPAPVENGRPTDYFPYAWSVVPWLDGAIALHEPPAASEAARLGEFLRALHDIPVPQNPPLNPYRGIPLAERRDVDQRRLQVASSALGSIATAESLLLLEEAYTTPIAAPPTWLHGDLHSKNVITQSGRIASVVDWGDICTGDPATDLASLWILFDPSNHQQFWDTYGVIDEDLYRRSRAWTVVFGLMIHESQYEADPIFSEAGMTALRRAVLGP